MTFKDLHPIAKPAAALGALLAGAAFFVTPAVSDDTTPAEAQARCEAFAQQISRPGMEIGKVHHVAASLATAGEAGPPIPALPAHCMVEGTINPRIGAGGVKYGIGFALALPDDWNGRFLLMGGGGLNGVVQPPIGSTASGDTPALARGFAVASHDSGHKGQVFEDTFSMDQRAALDFAETSVLAVTKAARDLTTEYYGAPVAHSYMTGCSTGGREGMLAIQRYPELFDGVVIGAPAMRTGDSNLALQKAAVDFNHAAPRDADGKPIVSQIFTDADRETILTGMLDQCDALDGLKDGMIENVAQCQFDPAKLQCSPGESEGCLAPEKATALKLGFQPPVDASGRALYLPFPYDTGIVEKMGGFLPSGMPGPFGPPNQSLSIDVDAEIAKVRANAMQRLTDTNYWTNLNTFLDEGGKTMFFHGVSDFWFSPWATWDWYQRAAETNGAAFTDASRFYMVPGMLHCRGGNAFDNFDLLTPMVEWVEQGKEPGTIVAKRSSGIEDRRPLCNYPEYPAYIGGDRAKADSFECRKPDVAS